MLRPSTLTTTGSPIFKPSPSAIFALKRDKRRALIVRPPPFAFDDARASRDIARIGDAAVALQHPGGIRRRFQVLGANAVGADDAPPQHRHALVTGVRRMLLGEGIEARHVGVLDVDEEHRGRLVGQGRDELAAQVAVDLQERHEQREAEAEREHDASRQRAGPMDIRQHQSQQRIARTRARCAQAT